MAFREVRTYFRLSDEEALSALNRKSNAFTFYMDAVMRGRFKMYSGPEVKGLNIVNLFLCDDGALGTTAAYYNKRGWHREMNMYQRKVIFDFSILRGTQEDLIEILIDVFTRYAEDSSLPQMQTLVRHIKESIGRISIPDVIEREGVWWRALVERNRRRNE